MFEKPGVPDPVFGVADSVGRVVVGAEVAGSDRFLPEQPEQKRIPEGKKFQEVDEELAPFPFPSLEGVGRERRVGQWTLLTVQ